MTNAKNSFVFARSKQAVCGLAVMAMGLSAANAGSRPYNLAHICKAAISVVIGRKPAFMSTNLIKGRVVYISYRRSSDQKRRAYRCRIRGSKIDWATANGRWQINPLDAKLTYRIVGGALTINARKNDGYSTNKIFRIGDF